MATSKDTKVKGKIVPLANGTRLRSAASTFTTVFNSYSAGAQVEIDLVREYTETVLASAIRAGDKWGRVISVNGAPPKKMDGAPVVGECWMAIYYQGATPPLICSSNYVPVAEDTERPIVKGAKLILEYEDNTTETVNLEVVK
jgi:hypothetical protein